MSDIAQLFVLNRSACAKREGQEEEREEGRERKRKGKGKKKGKGKRKRERGRSKRRKRKKKGNRKDGREERLMLEISTVVECQRQRE